MRIGLGWILNKQGCADLLRSSVDRLGLSLDEDKQKQLLGYLDGMLLWNKAYNLTAITDPKEALIKHIIDCLAIVPAFGRACDDRGGQATVLDIGTGAGLPALILAIMDSRLSVTALDSNQKKIRFIRQMISELGLPNLTPVASRIEAHSGTYDVITSRAFASLGDFVAVASPFLGEGGVLCAMKGKMPSEQELSALIDNWDIVSEPISVPNLSANRCLVSLTKK